MEETEHPESFNEHPLIQYIISMGMPPGDFAIFGSGPMAMHGLRSIDHDIDVIARGPAWEKAKEYAFPENSPMRFGKFIRLLDGKVEIYHSWFPKDAWDIDYLIDNAEIVDGVRYVRLEEVLKYKKIRNSIKDALDIKLIEEYLNSKKPCSQSET